MPGKTEKMIAMLAGQPVIPVIRIEDAANAPKLVAAALDAGFIVNATDEQTIRLAPPLVITTEQLGTLIAALPQLISAAS